MMHGNTKIKFIILLIQYTYTKFVYTYFRKYREKLIETFNGVLHMCLCEILATQDFRVFTDVTLSSSVSVFLLFERNLQGIRISVYLKPLHPCRWEH